MKYIRTKDDKIIDTTAYDHVKQTVIDGVLVGTQYLTRSNSNDFPMIVAHSIYETDIIKQADTIEELCDEFVLAKNDYFEYTTFRLFTTAKSLKLESVKNKEVVANIYGAIWTDKGLIYVTKMNEKGELELL